MAMSDLNHSFTKKLYKKPYPAISPTRPELSQKGKIVIVNGGSDGSGFAISKSFAAAGAAHIIITARRVEALETAKKSLESEFPELKVYIHTADLLDPGKAGPIVEDVRKSIGEPSILVLCASYLNPVVPILSVPAEENAKCFQANVTGNMSWVRAFVGEEAKHLDSNNEKIIINVSTLAATYQNPGMSSYGASKEAFVHLLGHLNQDYAGKGLRVHSMNPGIMWTRFITGFPEDFYDWDDVEVPGQTAVWLASPEAAFLTGRFIWASWDVEELIARKEEIAKAGSHMLHIGLIGEPQPYQSEERIPPTPRKGPLYG